MTSKFFVVLLTILAVGLLIVLSYRGNGIKTYPSYKTSSMRGFHLTYKDGNKIKWELISENATFPEGNREVILKDLTMKIHEYKIALTGGSGTYNIQDKNLIINRPIKIDIDGNKLTTDSLTWNGDEELISTKDAIKFEGKNFLIEGIGLIAKTENQQIKILENVKGIFYR
jgi:LPS export ABC transporter protein LptC